MGWKARVGILAGALALTMTGGCESKRDSGQSGQVAEYRSRAERLESARDHAGALDAFREAARRYPTQAWPFAGVGRAAAHLGRDREAEDAYETALRWDASLIEERVELARLRLFADRPGEALTSLEDAVRLGGETADRLALKSEVLAAAGRIPEARKSLERARELEPEALSIGVAQALLEARSDSTMQALAQLDGLALRHAEEPRVFTARATVRQQLGNADGAIADLVHVVEMDAHQPRHRFALAELLAERGRLVEASEHYRALLENNPQDARALEGLGTCAFAGGDAQAAEAAFLEAIEADPEFARAYLGLGRFLMAEGRADDAFDALRKARARAIQDPRLWEDCSLAMAEMHLQVGEAANSLDVIDAVLERNSESEIARKLRGRALMEGGGGSGSGIALEQIATGPGATPTEVLSYARWAMERGDAKRALEISEELLGNSPNDVDVRAFRAEAMLALGSAEKAEIELHEILDERGGHPAAHLVLARLYLKEGRLPDAVFHATEGEKLDPTNPNFAVLIGSAELARGDAGAAHSAFQREARLRPDSPKPWLSLGELEMQLGRADAAIPFFERAQNLAPSQWRASYLLGLAYTGAGRIDDAVNAYRRVLSGDERIAQAHNNLAWLLADHDLDPVLAEVHARRALELEPDNPQVLGTLGWAQYKNQLLDEAAESLQQAIRQRFEDPMKHYMLGVVQFARGLRDVARSEIETALEQNPDFERAGAATTLLKQLEQ